MTEILHYYPSVNDHETWPSAHGIWCVTCRAEFQVPEDDALVLRDSEVRWQLGVGYLMPARRIRRLEQSLAKATEIGEEHGCGDELRRLPR
ncbi:MAG TPA: hypothetical protein VEA38_25835 [Terriglobales bacterium]|nr:hypothetical protein [Terriglobales bacterium]